LTLPINRNLTNEFQQSSMNNTAGAQAPMNDFTTRPPIYGPDSLMDTRVVRFLGDHAVVNEDADLSEIMSNASSLPQLVEVSQGNLNAEALAPLEYEFQNPNSYASQRIRQMFDNMADHAQAVRNEMFSEIVDLQEKESDGSITPEEALMLDNLVAQCQEDLLMIRTLDQAERNRSAGHGQDRGLPSLNESQVRIHQGEGGASATLIEQRRADGYGANDDIIHASLEDSAGVNPHHAPVASDFSRPEHVYGSSRVHTSSRQGHENGRSSVHPSMIGMPVTPLGQSGHQAQISFNTPALINTSNQTTAAGGMYTGGSGAGANVPATGGFINITPSQTIPTLMDLAPAADIPIRMNGPSVLTAKTPASGVYWNAARHGQAVYG
jgi:hypothetical protein